MASPGAPGALVALDSARTEGAVDGVMQRGPQSLDRGLGRRGLGGGGDADPVRQKDGGKRRLARRAGIEPQ